MIDLDNPPVIGVSGSSKDSASVMAVMTQIRSTGAVPLFIGNHKGRIGRYQGEVAKAVQADLAKIDALYVMGNNGDINPKRYGAEKSDKTTIETDTFREQYEFEALQQAMRQRMPVLGICGGMQRINVLMGGTLHQHVPDIVGNESHSQKDGYFCPVQPVAFTPGTQLAGIAGHVRNIYTPEHGAGTLMENSMHHQAVNCLGTGLRIAATSPDGIIEAIEAVPDSSEGMPRVVFGVQFHPEFGASPFGAQLAENMAAAAALFAELGNRKHPLSEAMDESRFSSLPVTKTPAAPSHHFQQTIHAGGR